MPASHRTVWRLSQFLDAAPRAPDGHIDLREFDWSKGDERRARYRGEQIARVNFERSTAETGFQILGQSRFVDCRFDESVWELVDLHECTFERCSFDRCLFLGVDLGYRASYTDCTFRGLTAKGEYFSFGRASTFLRCSFDAIDLRHVGPVRGVRFEDCVLSGTLRDGTFHGRKDALRKRLSGLFELFSSVNQTVRFVRCDLSGLRTENVVFEDDVSFEDCVGTDAITQSRSPPRP